MKRHKLAITRGAFYGIIISWILIAISFVNLVQLQRKENHRSFENRRAIAFICSTTSVLDDLVVAAGNQLKMNFDNGSYDRLVRTGILTQQDIAAAKTSLIEYENAHRKLEDGASANGPCRLNRK